MGDRRHIEVREVVGERSGLTVYAVEAGYITWIVEVPTRVALRFVVLIARAYGLNFVKLMRGYFRNRSRGRR